VDIVTHGMMGVVLASPLLDSHPVAASLFALGSVLPDLDALSRLAGKRAFLAAHQTYSHALPVIAVIGGATSLAFWLAGTGAVFAGVGLAAGMALHSLLDATNTYGITLFAPLSRRRHCREWVFFIDSVVVTLSIAALAALLYLWDRTGHPPRWIGPAYAAAVAIYIAAKALLRRRAAAAAPAGTLALIPSALVPWRYLGCARDGDRVRAFRIDAMTGNLTDEDSVDTLDYQFADALAALPEVAIMRELTTAYHVVSAEPRGDNTAIVCRDLRTRNFATSFGRLDVTLDRDGQVIDKQFHV
jgi:membrane-bound metal-dependent hydrolase YbcI (DUF457 family)